MGGEGEDCAGGREGGGGEGGVRCDLREEVRVSGEKKRLRTLLNQYFS